MSSLLIKNGHVVTAVDSFEGDILVKDGKIELLGTHLDVLEPGARVIDADGLYVLPGGIDPHVHMELPVGGGLVSADDFESGTRAAIAGGTTSIIDFVTPEPGQSLLEALAERKEAAGKSLCDYGLHMSITSWNKNTPVEMRQCVENEGISSFKVYMAYQETIGINDAEILAVMDTAARLNARVTVHCEHGDIIRYLQKKFISEGKTAPKYHPLSRPAEVEAVAVGRALVMAGVTGCPVYIVHVSSDRALLGVIEAQRMKMDVAAETCPHYLLLDESRYRQKGFGGAAFVMSPPLRMETDKQSLWQALDSGRLHVVATDHCPFNMKDREERGGDDFTKIPNGVAGVEHRMALLYTHGVIDERISINRWVSLTSTGPAKLFGMYPRKGALAKGSDADIVIWDGLAENVISAGTHFHNCDSSIYEGFKVFGKPRMVIINGKIVYEKGKVTAKKGSGNYLYRKKV